MSVHSNSKSPVGGAAPHKIVASQNFDTNSMQSGEPALAFLTQDFPEWDLGDIGAFLTSEDDPEIIRKAKEQAILEKQFLV